VPPHVLDDLVERVARRRRVPERLTSDPWVGVEAVARHLLCRRQRIYNVLSRRGRR
jgi:hypothetical protein